MKRKQSACSLRTKEYKAIKIKSGQELERMVFNLIHDPFEKNNIYDEENQTMKKLFRRLDIIHKQSRKKAFESKQIILDKKTKEQLRALGYIK